MSSIKIRLVYDIICYEGLIFDDRNSDDGPSGLSFESPIETGNSAFKV